MRFSEPQLAFIKSIAFGLRLLCLVHGGIGLLNNALNAVFVVCKQAYAYAGLAGKIAAFKRVRCAESAGNVLADDGYLLFGFLTIGGSLFISTINSSPPQRISISSSRTVLRKRLATAFSS